MKPFKIFAVVLRDEFSRDEFSLSKIISLGLLENKRAICSYGAKNIGKYFHGLFYRMLIWNSQSVHLSVRTAEQNNF